MIRRALVVLSGGIDSTTLAYQMVHRTAWDISAVTFDYGQKHKREIKAAQETTHALGIPHEIVDLSVLAGVFSGSALTDNSVEVPAGEYSPETLAVTVVPNRNAIILSVAFAIAEREGAKVVGIGIHAGDHAVYPDCRPEFIEAFETMEQYSLNHRAKIYTPFLYWNKDRIIKEGLNLGVDYAATWSCYNGQEEPCLTCSTCQERIKAFRANGVNDPLAEEASM